MSDQHDDAADAEPPKPKQSFEQWFAQFDPEHPHIARLVALSDGIFAVALTLLALEIRPPEAWDGTLVGLGRGVRIGIAAYVVGFLILGALWSQHRRMLALMVRVDRWASALILATLCAVCLMPAAIGMQIRHSAQPMSFVIYGGAFAALLFTLAVFWGYIALVRRFIPPEIPERYRWGQLLVLVGNTAALTLAMFGFANLAPGGDLSVAGTVLCGTALVVGMVLSVVRSRFMLRPPAV